jgi:hypothetical protein
MVRSALLVLAGFASIAVFLYQPALDGPFLSDDYSLIIHNPWIHSLSGPALRDLLQPFGGATRATGNWAPVHLLAHALEARVFGSAVRGYHLVNVLLHAGNATLLLALFVRHGVPPLAALCGALLFLVHPANVEAVAWISQLKSVLALTAGLGALLLAPRSPLAALLLFLLASLTKPVAIGFVAFEAVRLLGVRRPRERSGWGWLAAWALVAVLTAVPAFAAFGQVGAFRAEGAPEGLAKLRWMASLLGRYVALALTSWGSSAFAQPIPPQRWLDPWVVLGLLALALCAARAAWTLAKGRVEAAFWALACAGYLPVAQWFPFKFPIADRYLYFVLPGLLGAGLLALPAAPPRRHWVSWVAGSCALLVALGLAARARERAGVWSSGEALLTDAAIHYPQGTQAQLLRATAAARAAQPEPALEALERARAQGFDDPVALAQDPAFVPLRSDPRFRLLVREMALEQIRRLRALPDPGRLDLQRLGMLHFLREEWSEAETAFRAALDAEGPGDPESLRRLIAAAGRERQRRHELPAPPPAAAMPPAATP